uniref:Agouti domain-containing protein n=1 Tax=Myripristis murdjan TaxID=586833 RepID=A0A668ALK6_9TELE
PEEFEKFNCFCHIPFCEPTLLKGHFRVYVFFFPPTVSLIQVRQRTLFARRGKYERQKMHVMKPKVAPAPPRRPPPKVAPNPISPRCSRTGESCLPQSRCCEPCATCHCRFFNAICFCRKTNSQCGRKT